MSDLEKIKYHIALLAESLDAREHPIEKLVVSLDWSEKDLDTAHDIFQKYDELLEKKEVIIWGGFEHDFHSQLQIGYQTLKLVVLAFFRNDQWVDVCRAYAIDKHCLEFSEITAGRRGYDSRLEEGIANDLAINNIEFIRETAIQGSGKQYRLDFLVTLPHRKIALEIKSTFLSPNAIESLFRMAELIKQASIADELWVVTDRNVELSSIPRNMKVISRDELVGELMGLA